MSWNYRVVRHEENDGWSEHFEIHEVYYRDGEPVMVTEGPVTPSGETLDELRAALELYTAALQQPALDYKAIAREG